MTEVATLTVGDHACAFYRGPAERDMLLRSFLAAGIRAGESCTCVVDDPSTIGGLFRGAEAATVLSTADYYLPDGEFVPARAAGQLPGLFDGAGDETVRVTGELGWFNALDAEIGDLLEYESLVNETVDGRAGTVLCLYDLDQFGAAVVGDLVRRHTATVAGGTVFRPSGPEWESGLSALLLADALMIGARDEAEAVDGLLGVCTGALGADLAAVISDPADFCPDGYGWSETWPLSDSLYLVAATTNPDPPGADLLGALAGQAAPYLARFGPSPGEVTRDLLDGRFTADAVRVPGIDLLGRLRAAVVRLPADQPSRLGDVRSALSRQGIVLVALRGPEVAMVLPGAVDEAVVAAAVGSAVPGAAMGVGGESVGPGGCARSYVEAGWAADLAGRAGRPLVRFEELGVLRLMAGADPRAAELFATDWLGDLAAHDETRNGELLNTLAAFLDSGASYAACAEGLGIHVSTLRYRLKRVADITGHDLTDSEVRFNLQLALRANGSLHALHHE